MKAHGDRIMTALQAVVPRTVRLCLEHRAVTLTFATSLLRTFVCAGAVPSHRSRATRNYGFSSCRSSCARLESHETRSVAEEVRQRLTKFDDVSAFIRRLVQPARTAFSRRPHVRKATLPCNCSRAASRSAAGRVRARSVQGPADDPGGAPVVRRRGFGEKLQISLAGDDANLLADVAQAWSRCARRRPSRT